MEFWVSIEKQLYHLAEATYPGKDKNSRINIHPIPSFLARDKTIESSLAKEIDDLRKTRNQIVHGQVDYKERLDQSMMEKMKTVLQKLKKITDKYNNNNI